MSGLENMKQRVNLAGGDADGRLVKGKKNSFHLALQNSYQAEWITFKNQKFRCLINPEKMTTDFDQKLLSIDFSAGIRPGDTFYWDRTGKHWIVYNEKEEEEAYFRARIRRCDYNIDCNGKKYWVYVRGPVETAIRWNQKSGEEFNSLNYTILMYVTKNEETLEYFTRHKVVKFEGHNWKVGATDKYSQEGIIEVVLTEDFDNEMEDAMIQPEEIQPDTKLPYIDGPQFVYPYDTNISYSIKKASNGAFVVKSSKVKLVDSNELSCKINILTGKSGNFTLYYEDLNGNKIAELPVTVKPL